MIQFVEHKDKQFDRRRFRMQSKDYEAYQRTFPDSRTPEQLAMAKRVLLDPTMAGTPAPRIDVPVAYHWETSEVAKGIFAEDLVFDPNEMAALAPPAKITDPQAIILLKKEVERLTTALKELGQRNLGDDKEAAQQQLRTFVSEVLNNEPMALGEIGTSEARQARASELGGLSVADLKARAGELEITFNSKTTAAALKKMILDKEFAPPEPKPEPAAAAT